MSKTHPKRRIQRGRTGAAVTGEVLPGVGDWLKPHKSVLGLIDNLLDNEKDMLVRKVGYPVITFLDERKYHIK